MLGHEVYAEWGNRWTWEEAGVDIETCMGPGQCDEVRTGEEFEQGRDSRWLNNGMLELF